MSGTSNVGNAGVYEANEQKAVEEQPERFEEGKENAHQANDSKDERSIANKLERETKKDESNEESLETQQLKKDPTLPARAHGNEPSRGAKIDKEIMDEEAEILKKKGAFGPKN
ncbi:hypothetical protein ANO11243_081900 [Dothideomycetidae sp. 11243]|nr:hypothetical protein ANO11243_081900 [fungal sp. No.11243]